MLLNSPLNDRYQFLEKLGQGGMGEVYKGRDIRSDTFVAIKQLHSTILNDDTVIERFRREGQALANLNHPNIVKMLDMIEQDGKYYLVTEYISGGDLATALKERGKFSVEESLKMGLGLADALSRAHQLGIIHRDLKPANVLIAADGSPRLTDFGVAHMESEERLTGTGMAVGTLDYLPPEVADGLAADFRADVWSFGVLLYEMLTGQRPFQGTTTFLLLKSILSDEPIELQEFCPEAPAELNELIQQMLQKERNERIRTARQVGAALEAILENDEIALRRLKTPATPVKVDVTILMEDSPTALATPVHPQKTSLSSPEIATSPQAQEAKAANWWPLITIVLLLVVIIFAGLVYSGTLAPLAPTASSTPTVTPEPSPTPIPITGDAPEGFRWISADEVQMLVPNAWIPIPLEMVLNLGSDFTPSQSDLDAAITYIEAQRTVRGFGDWVNIMGVVVMIQETSLILPDDVLRQRLADIGTEGSMRLDEGGYNLDLPIGRAYVLTAHQLSDGNGENNFDTHVEIYLVYHEPTPTLYTILFAGSQDDFEEQRETINTMLNSLQVIDVSAEATAEATSDN